MNVYYKISDGQPVDEKEALNGTTLRDGYGVRTSMTFMDGGGRTIPVGYVLDGSMLISDAQDGYEARLSAAWRGADARPSKRPKIERAACKLGELPASQTAFEKRLSDSWRAAA